MGKVRAVGIGRIARGYVLTDGKDCTTNLEAMPRRRRMIESMCTFARHWVLLPFALNMVAASGLKNLGQDWEMLDDASEGPKQVLALSFDGAMGMERVVSEGKKSWTERIHPSSSSSS